MILNAIELRCVGPFTEGVVLGPLSPGLNIIAAPNESGKSTTLRAAARALFDKHTTKDSEIKTLQPAGTDLCPSVVVEFQTNAGRFRIEKTFLQAPTSALREWQESRWSLIAEGDAADQRVQQLLNSSLPGRGATKPEHWGFLGFLWARQGEPMVWPSLQDEAAGRQIRAKLVRVELDPVIEKLRERLLGEAEEIITSTGRPRTNGPLERANDDLARVEAALSRLRDSRIEIDAVRQRYDQAVAAVAHLEREQSERTQAARNTSEQAGAAERLRSELDVRKTAFVAAQSRLEQVIKDTAAVQALEADCLQSKSALEVAEGNAAESKKQLATLHETIDNCQGEKPELERRLTELRQAHQRIQSLVRMRELSRQSDLAQSQLQLARESEKHLLSLKEKQSQIPDMSPAQLQRLQDFSDRVSALEAQIRALGLLVELTPERDVEIGVKSDNDSQTKSLKAGIPHMLHSPESISLELPGWGRVEIRSGAEEARNASQELVSEKNRFSDALRNAEVPSLEAAREALAARAAIKSEIKTATALHSQHLATHGSLADLAGAVATIKRSADAAATALAPSQQEIASSLADLESEDARLASAIPEADGRVKTLDAKLSALRVTEREAMEAMQKSMTEVSTRRTSTLTLGSRISGILERYTDGIDGAKTAAAMDAAKAEALLTETREKLPADFESLPERNRRAAGALQEVTNELERSRGERDSARGALESLGGQGIYSRETELEEQMAEIVLRRDAARTRGWATRIAHDLIEHRKQAATRAVLSPLEDRLTQAFAELTANRERRVFLDDNLQVAGIGRSRDRAHAFENLSQGAREQLLLCLRIAVAQELSTDEAHTLILDDVLVNTDSVRHERVLDMLGGLSQDLQILILTCHPERYRGIGETLSLRRRTDAP